MGKHRDHGRLAFFMLSICAGNLLAGCFGSKTYPNTLDKNLHVHTATDSGSWFSRVRAAVDIHRVGEDCTLAYEGTVQLADPKMDIGIPSHRWSYLVFVFANSSFLANRSGTITYETLLKPRAGSHYEVAVSYRNDTYHVGIRETPSNQSTDREIERLALSTCRSSSARK
ncbi:MAG: hypothetical protein ACREIM_03145 [Nitrospiraceae bacterium]